MKKENILTKALGLYRNLSVQVKASMWFVMSTVLIKGISFITVPIFTRIMTTEQYGLYSVYLTWCEIFTIFGTFGFESCAYVNALTKFDNDEKNDAQLSLLELAFVLTTVLLAVFLICGNWIAPIVSLPKNMLILMVAQIYFIPAVNFWLMKQRFSYHYKGVVLVSVLMAVLNACLGILFVKLGTEENQAFGRELSIVIVQAVFGIILLYKLIRGTRIHLVSKYWKWAMQLHLPLLPHTLSLKILAGADKIMINAMIGATATALYSVSYSVAVVVNLVKTSIVDAIRPWIYSKLKENKGEEIKKAINGILIFVAFLTLIFVAFAPEVIYIVAPENYYEAIYCMPPVMISSYFTFLYSVFSIVEMYYEETKKIMTASILAAVINVVLNFFFIRFFGYIAAAFTTLVCYIFLAIFHYITARKVLLENESQIELFDKKMILLVSVALICMMLVFEYLYSVWIVRYVFLLALCVVLFIKRTYFITLIKQFKKK